MFGAEPNLQDWVNRHLYSENTDFFCLFFFVYLFIICLFVYKWLNAHPCFRKMLISLMSHTVFINGLTRLRDCIFIFASL